MANHAIIYRSSRRIQFPEVVLMGSNVRIFNDDIKK